MKEMSYEDSLVRFEEILKSLNSSDISLNDSVLLFKEGIELYEHMKRLISNAESEIKTVGVDLDGLVVREEFTDIYGEGV